jgi:hypothetical protein
MGASDIDRTESSGQAKMGAAIRLQNLPGKGMSARRTRQISSKFELDKPTKKTVSSSTLFLGCGDKLLEIGFKVAVALLARGFEAAFGERFRLGALL